MAVTLYRQVGKGKARQSGPSECLYGDDRVAHVNASSNSCSFLNRSNIKVARPRLVLADITAPLNRLFRSLFAIATQTRTVICTRLRPMFAADGAALAAAVSLDGETVSEERGELPRPVLKSAR
jgi:hypothetical protein